MNSYPKKYNKEEVLKFLIKTNANDDVISKFKQLPETIKRSGNEFKLDINITCHNVGNIYYSFELNYYSEKLVEYLLNSKVFTNIDVSINYLMCELKNRNIIKEWDC